MTDADLMLCHGTPAAPFHHVDPLRLREDSAFGPGLYLTDDETLARKYTRGRGSVLATHVPVDGLIDLEAPAADALREEALVVASTAPPALRRLLLEETADEVTTGEDLYFSVAGVLSRTGTPNAQAELNRRLEQRGAVGLRFTEDLFGHCAPAVMLFPRFAALVHLSPR